MQLKVINTGFNSASLNFAMDEAVLELVQETGVPVLRLYGFAPTACTIGYFQGMQLEIDQTRAADAKVECVRRMTGGGAVMHDANQFTYSLVIPESMVPANIQESYEFICRPILEVLAEVGLQAEFAPLNDIILNGQKISGNAQTRKKGVVLQHGTLLLDVDVDLMFSLLLVPDEKLRDKLVASVKKRVTGINRHLPQALEFDELALKIAQQFSVLLDMDLDWDFDMELLSERVDQLQAKYSSDEWNLKY